MNKSKSSGQAIIGAMALILVGGVVLFLVFNSGRAVNEKINLVNAADAAAYSGAQIAARDLNYFAYTNRAMIANEIVVGHMVSYQAEVDVLMGIMADPQGPLGLVLNWLSAIGIPLGNGIMQAAESVREASEILSGIYILHAGANTQLYSDFQTQVMDALMSEDGGEHPIISMMEEVAEHYVQRPGLEIQVNDPFYLSQLSSDGLDGVDTSDQFQADYMSDLDEKANRALNFSDVLCQSIVFARPDVVAQGGGGGGGPTNVSCDGDGDPISDGGDFVSLVTRTMEGLPMGDWIRSRDESYGNFLTWNVTRTGSTEMQWVDNGGSGYLNWVANDSIESTSGLLHLVAPIDSSNTTDVNRITDSSVQMGGNIIVTALAALFGGCGSDVDCGSLAGTSYQGTQRYVSLSDPDQEIRVTAFLSHDNCNDKLGYTNTGQLQQDWNSDQTRYEEQACDSETVAAVSEAEVIYRRPACYQTGGGGCEYGFDDAGITSETANLFNPFWQAKLAN
ncbi:MAG: pilus assembly protein TadG-related protein [Pseudomonadales bacterium]|nr:pilus assembly protein TadG-related protein [Pseudomonadales bacterium]